MKKKIGFLASWDSILFIALCILLPLSYLGVIKGSRGELVLAFFSIIGLLPVFINAVKSLKNRKISVDLLASVALIISILNKEWISSVFINLMLVSARIFGAYTEGRARASIQSLLKLKPEHAKIKRGNEIINIPISEAKIGDLAIIESGEQIPFDGEIVQGHASIDQSSLTGESIPVSKSKNDKVLSSTLNVSGSLVIKIEKVGKDTTLEKIISLVEESQKGKPEIRTRADIFATWYIGLTIAGSVIVYAITRDLRMLLSLLLVACADDIAVALPMAFLAAIGYAAKRGVVIKGGHFLEGLTKAEVAIMDKTGTITRGKLKITDIALFNDFKEKDLLTWGGVAEMFSDHPVAKEIMAYVESKKIKIPKPDDYEETPGKGTVARLRGKKIISGNLHFMKENKIPVAKEQLRKINEVQDKGYNLTFIARDKKLVGFFVSADEIRPDAKNAIADMRTLGVKKFVMLTGDNEKVAERISNEIGIKTFHANLLPAGKLDYIKKYLSPNYKTIMIGDGVNDAASLALTDIGIAMGAIGSDAAIEAADIALMKDKFSEVPEMMELGKYTMKVANQDFLIWGTVNIIGLILVLGRFIGPEGASAYNFLTDFFPLLNSLRLFDLHKKLKP